VDRERVCDCVTDSVRIQGTRCLTRWPVYASTVYRSVQVRGWNFLKGTCASDGRGKHRKGKKMEGHLAVFDGSHSLPGQALPLSVTTCKNNSVTQ
jgi:hypothetical protein